MTCDMLNRSPASQSSTREKVLHLLRQSGANLTVSQIATGLKVHPNTVRFHLDTLTTRGLVQRVPSGPDGPGRPALRVRATAGLDPDGTRHYRALAEVLTLALTDVPDRVDLAQRGGRAWADRLLAEQPASHAAAPESVLMQVLDAASFAPEQTGPAEIGLRNCPFLELVGSAEQIVCSVHLGLMRGTLDALGADRTVVRLDPFVQPGLCVAHLAGRSTAA